MKTLSEVVKILEEKKCRSQYARGVRDYAIDLLDGISEEQFQKAAQEGKEELKNLLLNGADNWLHFSEGGCALVYDYDIAERLCPPSKRDRFINKGGCLYEQAEALTKAFYAILRIWKY